MSKGNTKKSRQLGMPYGTACYRLRKAILFRLAERAGVNICYRCGERIKSVRDFSVDHKTPWLDSAEPVELFFSLDNVAFSHMKCNYAAKRDGSKPIIGPEGTAWCSGCQDFLPEDKFGKNPHKSRKRVLRCYCNVCRKEKRNWGHARIV